MSSVATKGAAKGGVNTVALGITDALPRRIPRTTAPRTETDRAGFQVVVDQSVASSFMKRYGTTGEQAAAILFLASDKASTSRAPPCPWPGATRVSRDSTGGTP